MTSRAGTAALLLVALAAAGCGAPEDAGSGAEASCAALLDFDGHRYGPAGDLVREPRPGRRLGRGVQPGCDDGNGAAPARRAAVHGLLGVDPSTAVAGAGQVWVRDGASPPDLVARAARPVRCTGGPLRLEGAWESAETSRPPRTDGDLRPPYTIGVRTSDPAVAAGWVSVLVRVEVTEATARPSAAQVVRLLQEGDRAAVTVHCRGDRFVADRLGPA